MYIPTLPPQANLQYLAEGAANIVYRLSFRTSSPSIAADINPDDYDGTEPTTPRPTEIDALRYEPVFNGKLLRLRKALPSSVSNEESYRHFQDTIRPLFQAESLVEHILIQVPTHVITECNRQLVVDERNGGSRPRKRGSVYLAEDDPFGTLMTDMTPNTHAGEILVEFKPKWLVQSPSAPAGARRCRTCALTARKAALVQQRTGVVESKIALFCPLDLVSRDRSRVESAVRGILNLSKDPRGCTNELRSRLVDHLYQNRLLLRLKRLQEELDTVGIMRTAEISQPFLTAMTLRDCTMFLKVNSSARGVCSRAWLMPSIRSRRRRITP